MQKTFFIIILLFIAMQVQAERPPETYQQFKTEFLNTQPENSVFLDEQDITLIGAGLAAGVVASSGYFLMKRDTDTFSKVALIGGGAYLVYLAVVLLTEDERTLCPAYWDSFER